MNRLAKNIKEMRTEARMSQDKLAKALDVSGTAVMNWENGINEPKAGYIVALADYFKVSTDYILGRESEDGRIVVQELALESGERKLVDYYKTLPDNLKAALIEYAKSLNEINKDLTNFGKTHK